MTTDIVALDRVHVAGDDDDIERCRRIAGEAVVVSDTLSVPRLNNPARFGRHDPDKETAMADP
jgi:hypothetical protein